jgi:hypothetical protein
MTMKLTRKELEKMFPHLSKEMQGKTGSVSIDSVRTEPSDLESNPLRGYNPDVVDFLRRCENDGEGEEIIAFLEKRGEINPEYAVTLRRQLKEKGIRSFGPKKEADYYLKKLKP